MNKESLRFSGGLDDFKTILVELGFKVMAENEEEHGTQFRLVDSTVHFYHKSPRHSVMIDGKNKASVEEKLKARIDSVEVKAKIQNSFKTKDGHIVKSKSELIVDNWLFDNDIIHAYEKILEGSSIIPDFHLKKHDVYIEVFGDINVKYLDNKKDKQEYFKKHGIRVIEITPEDILNIDKAMHEHLRRFKIKVRE